MNNPITKLLSQKELNEYIPELYGKFNNYFILIKSKDEPQNKIENKDNFVYIQKIDISSIFFTRNKIEPFKWNHVIIGLNVGKVVVGWIFPTIDYNNLAELYQ